MLKLINWELETKPQEITRIIKTVNESQIHHLRIKNWERYLKASPELFATGNETSSDYPKIREGFVDDH